MAKTPTERAKKSAPTKRAPAKRRPVMRKTPVTATVVVPKPKTVARDIPRTYIFAVGRRKEAVARVRWYKDGQGEISINGRELANYFPVRESQQLVRSPLVVTNLEKSGRFSSKVSGGGPSGQAEAVRLGIARALVKKDADLRLPLKRAGFLRRDPRVKERKKYGLKRARRAPQWQKR